MSNPAALSRTATRSIFASIAAICLALLVNAYFLQYGPSQQQPCPLCILQRYAYMAIALVALIAATIGPERTGAIIAAGTVSIFAAGGAAIAIWQVAKGESMTSCMSDPVGIFVYNLPMRSLWPEFLAAYGGCADKVPPIFGISVPLWSFMCFMALTTICQFVLLKQFRGARN